MYVDGIKMTDILSLSFIYEVTFIPHDYIRVLMNRLARVSNGVVAYVTNKNKQIVIDIWKINNTWHHDCSWPYPDP